MYILNQKRDEADYIQHFFHHSHWNNLAYPALVYKYAQRVANDGVWGLSLDHCAKHNEQNNTL